MVTKGVKQVAAMAAVALMGISTIEEIAEDYIRFRTNSFEMIPEAMRIADEITERTGVQVSSVF